MVTADKPDWVPPGVDTQRANPARIYDYWLGGTHNFLADQDAGRAMAAIDPNTRAIAQANRAFLRRAVRFLAAVGIRQFLDIGSGIPTEGNVHQIAQQTAPGARIVYVDVDPVAIAHSQAILAGNSNAVIVAADLREPEKILAHDSTQSLIDFTEPVALLLSAVLHFIASDEDPWQIMTTLRNALTPGSYVVISHATDERNQAMAQAADKLYKRRVSTAGGFRSQADILQFFNGFEFVDPGLVYLPQWRPNSPSDVPSDPSKFWFLAGVARKP